MFFDQRMKEIEEDIVPFGFIQNGQDDVDLDIRNDTDNWQVSGYEPELSTTEGIFDRIKD